MGIERIERTFWLALTLWLFVTPSVALGQNLCASESETANWLAQSDSGLSGTGRSGGDESGMGGTGLSGADDSGIGGTGYSAGDESGIGGTGIYGTITAFGSICVNGLRIRYDEETPVSIDGRTSNSAALAIGQVVAVHAIAQGGVLEATTVAVHRALTGPVTSLDYAAKQLSVMGQRVIAPDDFSKEDYRLALGTRVSVSGLRRGDGVVVASRIVPVQADWPDGVSGLADTSVSGELWVGDIRIVRRDIENEISNRVGTDVASTAGTAIGTTEHDTPTIEPQQFVRITGSFNTETSALEASAVATPQMFRPAVERLSIEGYLGSGARLGKLDRPAGDLGTRLFGFELDRPSLERALSKLHWGRRLRVSGRRDAQGHLRVERIQILERPRLRPDIDRPGSTNLEKRTEPVERTVKPVPPRPNPPERPPKVERPDIDHPPRVDRVMNRIDTIKVDRSFSVDRK